LQGTGAEDILLTQRFRKSYTLLATFVGLTFLGTVTFLIRGFFFPQALKAQGTAEAFGTELFTRFLLPFEMTSLLLLLGVFAALALAKKDPS
ncbi:MAG: NADH-quinone oxidoreductase subunit J, partial [Candidatus Omnitrophica bacterium]|nr:NADH-quinone oxidoreductase subunit J [Candidatus Omnitrophota bacterium]